MKTWMMGAEENKRIAASLDDNACKNLLAEIAKRAVDDYRQALMITLKYPNKESETAKSTIRQCEKFFREGMDVYLDLDGEYIIKEVQAKAKQEVEEQNAKQRAAERKSAKERISAGVPEGACGDKQDLPTAGTVETGHDVSVGDD